MGFFDFLRSFKSDNQLRDTKNMEVSYEEVKPFKKPKLKKLGKVTKKQQVRTHLIEKGSITSLEAINLYGATRLASIIFELRNGSEMPIETEMLSKLDRNKNVVNYALYTFKK